MKNKILKSKRYSEANARNLISSFLDKDTFEEILDPRHHMVSPHLEMIGKPVEFDDGVVIGTGKLNKHSVYFAAQQGAFAGGTIGEIHGAKLVGLFRKAIIERPAAVIVAFDSGGVRLDEANIGLLAASEFSRAVLDARSAGINCIAMIGGSVGCYGGAALATKCFDYVIMNEKGRLGISGPVVIETNKGVEEFDSQDKSLVWRTFGGKNRYILDDADIFADDTIDSFRKAVLKIINKPIELNLENIKKEQNKLAKRTKKYFGCNDSLDIWGKTGFTEPDKIPAMNYDQFIELCSSVKEIL
jgi:malonate decarboxylase beta subunit